MLILWPTGTDTEDLFVTSGSAVRLRELETIFNSPPRYGKGLNWIGYTVHDAANILLRYLLQLPSSVIPVEHYEAFHLPIRTLKDDVQGAARTFQTLIKLLPPLSRQLLLYILDLLAVFASKSELNKLQCSRLAPVFQPAILSPVKFNDGCIEEQGARRHSCEVLTFLIENQDEFLIGSSLGGGKEESEEKKLKDQVVSNIPEGRQEGTRPLVRANSVPTKRSGGASLSY